jgi:hypothetical protein
MREMENELLDNQRRETSRFLIPTKNACVRTLSVWQWPVDPTNIAAFRRVHCPRKAGVLNQNAVLHNAAHGLSPITFMAMSKVPIS